MELVAGRVGVDVCLERGGDRVADPGRDQRQAGRRAGDLVERRAGAQPRPAAKLLAVGPQQVAFDGEGRGIVAGGHVPECEVDPFADAQVGGGGHAPKVREDRLAERREAGEDRDPKVPRRRLEVARDEQRVTQRRSVEPIGCDQRDARGEPAIRTAIREEREAGRDHVARVVRLFPEAVGGRIEGVRREEGRVKPEIGDQ